MPLLLPRILRRLFPLLLLAGPALAESPGEALFPSEISCYRRVYDQAHLARHPDQLAKEIAVGPVPDSMKAGQLVLQVAVSLRGNPEIFLGYAYCDNTGGTLSCGLEGDAGWFQMKPTAKGALLMVGRDGIGFEGDTGFVELGGGRSDDEAFSMPKVPAKSCP